MSIAVSRSSSSHSVPYGRAVAAPCCCRRSLVTRLLLAEPFGHSRPREIGLSGSPSIWVTSPSLTKTRCPQPTAQYGQTERAIESAVSVRAVSAAERGGLRRRAPAQRVGAGQLPVDRPALDPGADAHEIDINPPRTRPLGPPCADLGVVVAYSGRMRHLWPTTTPRSALKRAHLSRSIGMEMLRYHHCLGNNSGDDRGRSSRNHFCFRPRLSSDGHQLGAARRPGRFRPRQPGGRRRTAGPRRSVAGGVHATSQSGTRWGHFDATSLITAFGRYIDLNETDARWVAQIAAAFRAAGGDGALTRLPDAAIEASLRAAGLDGGRAVGDLRRSGGLRLPGHHAATPTTR